jgi:hypothetical protein
MTAADKKLREALRDWRNTQLQSLGASTGDDMFGAQFIMTDEILERIVDMAHFGKLTDLVTFQSQVNWRYCDRWGTQILGIVTVHFPPVATPPRDSLRPVDNLPGPSTGRQSLTTSGSTGATNMASGSKPRARRQSRCGSCGSTSHIGKGVLFYTPCRRLNSVHSPTSFESHVPKPQIAQGG